jgi:cytochrome P450
MIGVDDYVTMPFDYEHHPDLPDHHFEVFDELTDGPDVVYSTTPGYWMVTGMDVIHEALSRADVFSSRALSAMKSNRDRRVPYRFVPQELDPPEHGKYRKVLTPLLSPMKMKDRDPRIREVATELATALRARGSCDVVADFARPLVMKVFLEMFGLPTEDSNDFADLASRVLVGYPDDADGSRVRAIFDTITEILADNIDRRRRDPTDDLLSGIVQGTVDGEPIREDRLAEMAIQVFTAGLETTVAAFAYLIRHCADNPDVQERLRTDRDLVPNAVEESLRFYSQISMSRRITKDADFHGCPMKAGDYLVLPAACANRDPRVFEDGRTFDLMREKNRHIAFGTGPHRCVGSHLARVELYAAADVWHQVIPTYRHTADASRKDYVVAVSGPVSVNVEWG